MISASPVPLTDSLSFADASGSHGGPVGGVASEYCAHHTGAHAKICSGSSRPKTTGSVPWAHRAGESSRLPAATSSGPRGNRRCLSGWERR